MRRFLLQVTKVHKSVGFGRAANSNVDDNVNADENADVHCKLISVHCTSTTVLSLKYSSTDVQVLQYFFDSTDS